MQGCTKADDAGWPVFEESRLGGAIIANGYKHSYVRTHLLSNFAKQTVSDSLVGPLHVKKGETFSLVSGLGGETPRPICVKGPWFGKQYGDNAGAMFVTFNIGGMLNRTHFYFKDIKGVVIDSFDVISEVNPGPTLVRKGPNSYELRSEKDYLTGGKSLEIFELNG